MCHEQRITNHRHEKSPGNLILSINLTFILSPSNYRPRYIQFRDNGNEWITVDSEYLIIIFWSIGWYKFRWIKCRYLHSCQRFDHWLGSQWAEKKRTNVKWIFFSTKLNCFMRSSPPPGAVTNVVGGNLEAVSYIWKNKGTCVTEWLELKERKHVFKEAVINYILLTRIDIKENRGNWFTQNDIYKLINYIFHFCRNFRFIHFWASQVGGI